MEQEKILGKLGIVERPNVSLATADIPSVLLRRFSSGLGQGQADPKTNAAIPAKQPDDPKEFFVIGQRPQQGTF